MLRPSKYRTGPARHTAATPQRRLISDSHSLSCTPYSRTQPLNMGQQSSVPTLILKWPVIPATPSCRLRLPRPLLPVSSVVFSVAQKIKGRDRELTMQTLFPLSSIFGSSDLPSTGSLSRGVSHDPLNIQREKPTGTIGMHIHFSHVD